jgi:hypothetical protein
MRTRDHVSGRERNSIARRHLGRRGIPTLNVLRALLTLWLGAVSAVEAAPALELVEPSVVHELERSGFDRVPLLTLTPLKQLMNEFTGYDRNGDGTVEIRSLSLMSFEQTRAAVPSDGGPLVIVFVRG